MLATKISFINEISNICEKVGADVNQVRNGIGSDSRIGYKFIYPGCGYGGSCFPKDVKALINIANKNDYYPNLISAVEKVNDLQKDVLFLKVVKKFGQDLSGIKFSIWGLSFKPETDDMREAPSINLINSLANSGAIINAYDPQAIDEAKFYLKDLEINYFDNKYEALKESDAVILVTEWKEFRSPDFERMIKLMNGNVFIDGRNQFNHDDMNSIGFNYFQIGVK
jgi:UDPglucose 6-dehydrogenase